ncbi:hypothetical protein pdam_00006272 [Pocillopora damicornis]|uniref:Uncharacterized protein n=1 Tax=Pocillopora damicornis TaxID=46731 RepID=A0A3M6URB1_POCDA|nr:hypothetical protein pdam_00006272 [Pocillopora damicornis]
MFTYLKTQKGINFMAAHRRNTKPPNVRWRVRSYTLLKNIMPRFREKILMMPMPYIPCSSSPTIRDKILVIMGKRENLKQERNSVTGRPLTGSNRPHVNSLKNFPSNLTPTAPPNPSKNILHAKKYPTSLGPKQRGLLMTKRLVTPSRPIVVRVRMATTKTSRSKLFLPTSLCFLNMLTRTFKLLISKKLCFSWVAFSWLSGTRKITQRPHIK